VPPDEPVRPRTAEERRIAALEAQLRERDRDLIERNRENRELVKERLKRSRSVTPQPQRIEVVQAPPPLPAPRSLFPGASRAPQWALGIAALIAAVGGGAGISQILHPAQKDWTPQLEEIRADIKQQSEDVREIRDYIRKQSRVDSERWDLTVAVLCKLNGKPFGRAVDCGAVGFEQRPLGAPESQSPGYKALAEWPMSTRPP
jgi:hypothetical protein